MTDTTSHHHMSSSSFSRHHHQQQHEDHHQEDDESDLSSLDGEGDTDMEEHIPATSNSESRIYNITSFDTSSPSICLPLLHPPSTSSSIVKHDDGNNARQSRSMSPEIPLAQLAIHNGSLPPALQLQLPAASHRLQPQSMMDISPLPDIPLRSSIKRRRRGQAAEPASSIISNVTPSNMVIDASTSSSTSTSTSTRKTANLSRFSKLYSAQSSQSHSHPPVRNKRTKSTLQDDAPPLLPPHLPVPSAPTSSRPISKLKRAPTTHTDAKDELKSRKIDKNHVMEVDHNHNEDDDPVSLLFAIGEERNAAVVARERIASAELKMDVDHYLNDEEELGRRKTSAKDSQSARKGGEIPKEGSLISSNVKALLSAKSKSKSSSTPSSSYKKTTATQRGRNHQEKAEPPASTSKSVTGTTSTAAAAAETGEIGRLIKARDWRGRATSIPHQDKYKIGKGLKYHGKSFGENLAEFIEAHPDSTTVTWSADKEYLLIYDLDKLRRELNAAGLAQQSHVYSLKKQLNNYHYFLVNELAIRKKFTAGLKPEQKALLQIYKHTPPAADSDEDNEDLTPAHTPSEAKLAMPEVEAGPQSESELSDVVADDEGEASENHTVKEADASVSSSSRYVTRHTSSIKGDFVSTDCSETKSCREESGQSTMPDEDQALNTRPVIGIKTRGSRPGRPKAALLAKEESTQPAQTLKEYGNIMIRNTRSNKRSIIEAAESEASITAETAPFKRGANLQVWRDKRKAPRQARDEIRREIDNADTASEQQQAVQTPPRKKAKILHQSPGSSRVKATSSSSPRRNVIASQSSRRSQKNMSLSPRRKAQEGATPLPTQTRKMINARAQSFTPEIKHDSPRLRRQRLSSSQYQPHLGMEEQTPRLKRKIGRSASPKRSSGPDDPLTDPRFLRALARRRSPSPPAQRRIGIKGEVNESEQADQDTEDDVPAMKKYEDAGDADVESVEDTCAGSEAPIPETIIKTMDVKLEEEGGECKAETGPDCAQPTSTATSTSEQQTSEEDYETKLPARSPEKRSTSPQPVSARPAIWQAVNGLIKSSKAGKPRKLPIMERLPVSFLPRRSRVAHDPAMMLGNIAEAALLAEPSIDAEGADNKAQKQDDMCLDTPAVPVKLRENSRSMSLSTVATSICSDEPQLQTDQVAEDQSDSVPNVTLQIKSMLAQAIPSVEVELASCNGTPELEVDNEDDALCHGDTSTDSGYHASSKFFPEYLHPMSSPALCPVPDVPIIKNDPADEDDLAELLFRINMPSPRAMLAGLPTGRTPETYQNKFEANNNNGKSGLSRLDSTESVLWSRSNALKAELPNLKFAGSSIPVFSDKGMLPSQSDMNEDLVKLAHPAGLYNNRPFESNPPVPPEWKIFEIFSPVKTRFDHQLRMKNVQSWALSSGAAGYGERRSPERMLEDTPSQYGSEGSRGKSISPFDTVLKY